MTRRADIPAEDRVRRVLDQYLTECRDNGNCPSVLGLATRLGMSNTTFRRHFPQQAKEISETRSRTERPGAAETPPGPYEILTARNARLRRANRTLAGKLKLAAAQIQRLGIENARLREALEAPAMSAASASPAISVDRPKTPKVTSAELPKLPREPHGCPSESGHPQNH